MSKRTFELGDKVRLTKELYDEKRKRCLLPADSVVTIGGEGDGCGFYPIKEMGDLMISGDDLITVERIVHGEIGDTAVLFKRIGDKVIVRMFEILNITCRNTAPNKEQNWMTEQISYKLLHEEKDAELIAVSSYGDKQMGDYNRWLIATEKDFFTYKDIIDRDLTLGAIPLGCGSVSIKAPQKAKVYKSKLI